MAFSRKLIHLITSRMPTSWHIKLSGFYAKHACVTIFNKKGLWTALSEIFFHKYTGKNAHHKRLKKLEEIRKKDVITVVFQVWSLAKWKSDSVYKAMANHPRFRPVIWITDDPSYLPQEKIAMRKKMEEFFSKDDYLCYYAENRDDLYQKVQPDITFIQEPYEYNQDAVRSVLDGELLCYVCYYVSDTVSKSGHTHFLLLSSVLRFVENQSVYNELSKLLNNRSYNFSIAGHPAFDYLREGKTYCLLDMNNIWKNYRPTTKKLIWAPHWTIGNQSFFSNGSFLSICDDMVNLAKKYADRLHIAFKPHPTLYRTLCNHPDWGQEKTDAYYKQWETMPNTQVEEGEYRKLFWSSDAMIHDCGSFIMEYPMVNKPCMYLQRGEGYGNFNELAKASLNCYTIGKNVVDIEKFILEQVLGNQDPKKEVRTEVIKQYLSPYKGKSAAENIIDAILASS